MDHPDRPAPGPRHTLSRRRAIGVGAAGVSAAAVLAACGNDTATPAPPTLPQSGEPPVTATVPEVSVDDVVLLRTSASVSRAVATGYDEVLGLGVLPEEITSVFGRFRDHHEAQAEVMDEAVREAGGQPSSEPNPKMVADDIRPTVEKIQENGSQVDQVVRFMLGLEQVAASTQQSFVPIVTQAAYRRTLMEVGGAQARQAAVVAGFVDGATTVPPPQTEGEQQPAVLPVAQVPSTFGTVSAVQVQIGEEVVSFTIPGPASYVYEP